MEDVLVVIEAIFHALAGTADGITLVVEQVADLADGFHIGELEDLMNTRHNPSHSLGHECEACWSFINCLAGQKKGMLLQEHPLGIWSGRQDSNL